MMKADLTIIYEPGDDGWWIATVAEVPGAFSQGKTKDEARENVLDALQELMAARREIALRERQTDAVVESLSLAT
ncbi:MAG: type II toxin-antitoxin system HicB family antitoxin [Phycisphaerae bacterium]